jgi:hypothetical protein
MRGVRTKAVVRQNREVLAKIEKLMRDGPSSWTREKLTELFGEPIGG